MKGPSRLGVGCDLVEHHNRSMDAYSNKYGGTSSAKVKKRLFGIHQMTENQFIHEVTSSDGGDFADD